VAHPEHHASPFDDPAAPLQVEVHEPDLVPEPARPLAAQHQLLRIHPEQGGDAGEEGPGDALQGFQIDLGAGQMGRHILARELVAGTRDPGDARAFRDLQETIAPIEISVPLSTLRLLERGPAVLDSGSGRGSGLRDRLDHRRGPQPRIDDREAVQESIFLWRLHGGGRAGEPDQKQPGEHGESSSHPSSPSSM
jgi:hypothetical protein